MARARGDRLSLAVLLSFNELAWIVVFALAVLYSTAAARAQHEHRAADELRAERACLEAESHPLARPGEAVLRQELLGLKGDFKNVAILVDRSGSMAQGGRWERVRDTVHLWIQHLALERATLVLFSDGAAEFPSDGAWFDMTGGDAEKNREALANYFASTQPGGNTNTLAALERAYARTDVDTIVLFTDGAPDAGAGFDERMASRIYALIQAQKSAGRAIPINAVGLGNYFDRRLGEFLMRVAAESGGVFLGR